MLTSIVAAVVILGLLIIVHELGHFMVAKRCGVRVLRFSIGYPPKLLSFRRGETEYSIGATPFGGYVRMLGDEVADELGPEDIRTFLKEIGQDLVDRARNASGKNVLAQSDDLGAQLLALSRLPGIAEARRLESVETFGRQLKPEEAMLLAELSRSESFEKALEALAKDPPPALLNRMKQSAFPTQSLAKRLAIVLAGPAANLLFAPILLTIVFMWGVPKLLPVVGQIKKDLPAAAAGLKSGDRINSINGHSIESWEDLSKIVKASNGAPLKFEFQREENGSLVAHSVVIVPAKEQQKTVTGDTAGQFVVGILPRGDYVLSRANPISAAGHAVVESARITGLLVVGIAKLIGGSTPLRQALGGPIMIAQLAGHEAHEGFANIALFTVMLSIQLGIINLFPIPMLDGGHLLFFAFEGVRGKPLKLRHREIAQQVGLFLLVALMAFVIFNDISRIVQG